MGDENSQQLSLLYFLRIPNEGVRAWPYKTVCAAPQASGEKPATTKFAFLLFFFFTVVISALGIGRNIGSPVDHLVSKDVMIHTYSTLPVFTES